MCYNMLSLSLSLSLSLALALALALSLFLSLSLSLSLSFVGEWTLVAADIFGSLEPAGVDVFHACLQPPSSSLLRSTLSATRPAESVICSRPSGLATHALTERERERGRWTSRHWIAHHLCEVYWFLVKIMILTSFPEIIVSRTKRSLRRLRGSLNPAYSEVLASLF